MGLIPTDDKLPKQLHFKTALKETLCDNDDENEKLFATFKSFADNLSSFGRLGERECGAMFKSKKGWLRDQKQKWATREVKCLSDVIDNFREIAAKEFMLGN